MQLNLYSTKGAKLNKKVTLYPEVFEVKVNVPLMTQAVYIYRNNQRQGTAHTKSRGEVRGGGAKPWAQKGTGRARHGSIRSPIWKGGGVAFGPRNNRNYKRKLGSQMRKSAIRSAFSSLAKENKIVVMEKTDLKKEKLTKQVVALTKKLPVEKKVLYIITKEDRNVYLGSRNLEKVNAIGVNEINVYELMNHEFVVIAKDALDVIHNNWGKEGKKEKVPVKQAPKKVVKEEKEEKEPKKALRKLEDLGLSTRIINALSNQGLTTIAKLRKVAEDEKKLDKVEGVGPKSIKDIKKALNIK